MGELSFDRLEGMRVGETISVRYGSEGEWRDIRVLCKACSVRSGGLYKWTCGLGKMEQEVIITKLVDL